jgi:hypothetical protein
VSEAAKMNLALQFIMDQLNKMESNLSNVHAGQAQMGTSIIIKKVIKNDFSGIQHKIISNISGIRSGQERRLKRKQWIS